jgi:hypothetical protein
MSSKSAANGAALEAAMAAPFIIILFLKKLVDSFRAWMIPKKN